MKFPCEDSHSFSYCKAILARADTFVPSWLKSGSAPIGLVVSRSLFTVVSYNDPWDIKRLLRLTLAANYASAVEFI